MFGQTTRITRVVLISLSKNRHDGLEKGGAEMDIGERLKPFRELKGRMRRTLAVKAQAQYEERLGGTLLDEMRRVQRKAWELLARTESEGDHRGSIVALREVRECLESLGEMLEKADTASVGSAQDQLCDWGMLSDEELHALEALLTKALSRRIGT
jgi:hypothetical protein